MHAELVQPKDLVVTDGGVFRLEHGRRYPIDVLYRRLDEDLLDHVPGADGRPLGRRLTCRGSLRWGCARQRSG